MPRRSLQAKPGLAGWAGGTPASRQRPSPLQQLGPRCVTNGCRGICARRLCAGVTVVRASLHLSQKLLLSSRSVTARSFCEVAPARAARTSGPHRASLQAPPCGRDRRGPEAPRSAGGRLRCSAIGRGWKPQPPATTRPARRRPLQSERALESPARATAKSSGEAGSRRLGGRFPRKPAASFTAAAARAALRHQRLSGHLCPWPVCRRHGCAAIPAPVSEAPPIESFGDSPFVLRGRTRPRSADLWSASGLAASSTLRTGPTWPRSAAVRWRPPSLQRHRSGLEAPTTSHHPACETQATPIGTRVGVAGACHGVVFRRSRVSPAGRAVPQQAGSVLHRCSSSGRAASPTVVGASVPVACVQASRLCGHPCPHRGAMGAERSGDGRCHRGDGPQPKQCSDRADPAPA